MPLRHNYLFAISKLEIYIFLEIIIIKLNMSFRHNYLILIFEIGNKYIS